MKPETLTTLDQLERADWFANVGVRDAQRAIVLTSWEEAIDHCSALEWENLCLEATNQFCERSPVRFKEWNRITEKVKATTVPLVRRKIKPVVDEHGLPKEFEDTVQWDVLGVCMEAEYADVHQPGWYLSQTYWYIKGHFPCGWQGDFPNGTLIIY